MCDCVNTTTAFNPRSVRTGHLIHDSSDYEWVLLGQDGTGNWCVMEKSFSAYDKPYRISYLRPSQLSSLQNCHTPSEMVAGTPNHLPTDASGRTMTLAELTAQVNADITASRFVIPTSTPTEKTLARYYNRRMGVDSKTATANTAAVRSRAVARTEEEIAELYAKVATAVNDPNKFWYESEKDSTFVRSFVRLRMEAGVIGNLLISGPSGAGKTEGVLRLAEELGIPVNVMSCPIVTTPEKWIGRRDVMADGTTAFTVSEHLKWVEATGAENGGYEPGIILYDEINRLHPDRTNVLYSLLDKQRRLFVPDVGRYFYMNPANIVIATANIGSAFSGTFGFDRALRERFNFTQERKFPPKAEEIKILTTATGIEKAEAKAIVDIMSLTRRDWERDELESPVSTRTGLAWATLVSSGYSIVDAAEYTAVPLYKDEGGNTSDRAKFRLLISSKLGAEVEDE